MKRFIRSVFPKEFFERPEHFRALVLGVLYLGTLVAQLFTFERFKGVLAGYAFPGSELTVALLSWLLPGLALLSLPLLLSMRISGVLHATSRTAVVALPLLWLAIGTWGNVAVGYGGNAGLFGATLVVPIGLWQIALALLWLWAAVLVVRELPLRKQGA